MIGSVAQPCCFFACSSTLMDSGADSMSLEVLLVSLVFKYVRTPTTCLGRPRLYNCDVMFAVLSQEHITDNETNTQFPVLQCGETWEGARSSARGCGDPMSVATFFASAISLQQGKPPPLPCLSASAFALHLIPRFCLLTRVTALLWL